MMLFALALLAQDPVTPEASSPPTPEIPLSVYREPVVSFSEEGDAAGHTGDTVVDVVLHPDGTREPAVVVESSRSEILDQAALETIDEAQMRAPSAAVRLRVTVQFRPTEALTMRCDEFARQVLWYEAAWPERDRTDTLIYTMTLGLFVMLDPTLMTGGAQNLPRFVENFGRAFDDTVDHCERRPDDLYLDTLRAEL